MFPRFSIAGLAALCGCHAAAEVCPLPVVEAGTPADANGDIVVDVADALVVHRYVYESGPAPVCEDAVIFRRGQGLVLEGADLQAMLSHLYEGLASPADSPRCTTQPDPDPGVCGRVGWSWDAPRRAAGTGSVAAKATLQIVNESLEAGVEGWSVGVTAEGCTIDTASVDGTVAAPWTGDDGAGTVTEGFVMARVHDAAATSAVVLNWLHHQALAPSRSPYAVLSLDVSAPAPAEGCIDCTLTTVDGLENYGEPVPAALGSSGRSYRPEPQSVSISMCAP